MVAQTTGTGTPLTPIQAAWMRALAKAQALGTTPIQHGAGRYTVVGSHGDTYHVVRLTPHCTAYECTCRAGQEGKPCYHAAACAALPYEAAGRSAYRRRLARQGRAAA